MLHIAVYVVAPGSLEHEGTQFTQQLLLCFTLFEAEPLSELHSRFTTAAGFKVTSAISYPVLIASVVPL